MPCFLPAPRSAACGTSGGDTFDDGLRNGGGDNTAQLPARGREQEPRWQKLLYSTTSAHQTILATDSKMRTTGED
jgi:hypothetical protein